METQCPHHVANKAKTELQFFQRPLKTCSKKTPVLKYSVVPKKPQNNNNNKEPEVPQEELQCLLHPHCLIFSAPEVDVCSSLVVTCW